MRTACIIFSVLGIVDSFSRFMSNISDIWDFVAKSEYQEQEEVDAFMEVHKFLEVDITEDDVRRALTVIFTMSCIDIVFSGLALLTNLNSSLRGLSLGGRFLTCDCRIRWITTWIRTLDLQVTSRERNPQFCGNPQELRDRSFYQLSEEGKRS